MGGETPQKPSFAVLKSIPCLPVNLSLMADQVTADDNAMLPGSLPRMSILVFKHSDGRHLANHHRSTTFQLVIDLRTNLPLIVFFPLFIVKLKTFNFLLTSKTGRSIKYRKKLTEKWQRSIEIDMIN